VTYTSPNATGSLTYTPVANKFGTAIITVTVSDGMDSTIRTFTVTVNAVADTPTISNATTNEDAQSTSGLVIARNAADGAEVTHFKIASVTGGALFYNDGATPLPPGTFVTVAQGAAGLKFTPAPDSFATGHVTVQASISALDAGLGGGTVTADITVTPIAEAPLVTPASTTEDTQTTSGLVISRSPADGVEVTHFKITAIANGTLFQNDGTTPIANGAVITFAQGNAGLKFTPAPNFFGAGSFVAQGATSAAGTGAGGGTIVSIAVSAVADTPSITNASTIVNVQTTSGLVIARNAADGAEVTHVKVTAISNGTLFKNDGTTPIAAGAFITIAEGAAGLKFTPLTNSVATGHVSIQASTSNADAGLGGGIVTADIVVNQLTSMTALVTSQSPTNPGEAVTFTATVTPALAGANGTVQFMDGGSPLGSPVALSAGAAALTTSSLAPGTHTITAVYSGNVLATGSTGTLAGGQIVREPVTVVVSASANPSPLESPVTITATPNHAGGGTATGTITFTEGPATLATVTLGGGTASFTTSTLPLGVHHIVAAYGGDAAFAPGSGSMDLTIVCPTITIDPSTIPAAVVGVPYSQTFTQSGGVGTIAFSLGGALPSGLSFTAATATLSGTPMAAGSYPITVTATPANGCGAVSASYTLLVGGGRTVLTGGDAGGGPHVRRFSAIDGSAPTGGALDSFFAFDASFAGGVRVAEGDVNGDGEPDYIAGAGPGAEPRIHVFDGATGVLLYSILAFEPDFRGGVFVAAGDVDGDGFADIVAGSGEGRSGQVRVFSGYDGHVLRDLFVFERAFTGGVRVAAGDVNGDGRADLVVAGGFGRPSEVRVLNADDGATLRAFSPYGPFVGGVFVAAADVTGDGFADIVTGGDAGGGPHVLAFDGVTGLATLSFYAFEPGFAGGVRVAAGDVTGDGRADVIVGAGPGRTAAVRVFDAATAALISETEPYGPLWPGGLFVATNVPLNRMSVNPPAPNSEVNGPFLVAGWAFVDNQTSAGISAIHVWALPADGGTPTFLGLATLGAARPDVAAFYGSQYGQSGFYVEAAPLPPGAYYIAVFAVSSVTGTTQVVRVTQITVVP
jgi:hypothetical protein